MRWWIAAAAALAWPGATQAACRSHPWSHASASVRALVTPVRLSLVAGAIAAPFAMAPTGADHGVRVLTQRDLGGRYDLERTSLTVPYALGGALVTAVLATELFGDCEGARVSSALLQSVVVAAALSTTLKYALGRGYPTGGGDPYATDRLADSSRATRFHGPPTFGAWPSGHSAVTFAFASALRTALPHAGPWRYAGYLLGTGVGLAMIWGDHHWASDVVSGALFGEAIGSSIGTGFAGAEPRRSWSLAPGPGGAVLLGTF